MLYYSSSVLTQSVLDRLDTVRQQLNRPHVKSTVTWHVALSVARRPPVETHRQRHDVGCKFHNNKITASLWSVNKQQPWLS